MVDQDEEQESQHSDDDKDKGGDKKVTLETLTEALRFLGKNQIEFQKNMTVAMKELSEGGKRRLASPDPDDDGKKKVEPNEVSDEDLERMSRREYTEYLLEQMTPKFRELLDPITKRFGDGEDKQERRNIRGDIDAAAEDYGDFWQWQEEIKSVLDKRPDLSIDEAYHLARGQNQNKQQELLQKQADADKKKADDESKEKEGEFGGLMPTSSLTRRAETMDADKAAAAAWEEHLSGTPFEEMTKVN